MTVDQLQKQAADMDIFVTGYKAALEWTAQKLLADVKKENVDVAAPQA